MLVTVNCVEQLTTMYVIVLLAHYSGSLSESGGLPDSCPGRAHPEPGTFSTAESAAHTGRGAGRGREREVWVLINACMKK